MVRRKKKERMEELSDIIHDLLVEQHMHAACSCDLYQTSKNAEDIF